MAVVELIDSTSARMTTAALSVPAPTLEDGCSVWIAAVGRGSVAILDEPPGDPAGFSLAGTDSSGSASTSHIKFYLWKKNVATAANEPANYTGTYSTTVHGNVFAFSLRNAEMAADPLIVKLVETDGTNTFDCPAIAVDTAGTLVLHLPSQTASGGITGFSGADVNYVELEDPGIASGTNRQAGALYYDVVDATTAPTTYTCTGTTLGISMGLSIAIEPAGGGGNPDPDPIPVAGTTIGDLLMPWRVANGLENWGDFVDFISIQTGGIGNFGDASFEYWKTAAGVTG